MVLPALHGAWSDTHLLSPHRLPQTPRRQLRPIRDGSVSQRRSPDVFRWIRAKSKQRAKALLFAAAKIGEFATSLGVSLEQLCGIEAVAMDMWEPYATSVRAHLADADR